MNKLFITLIILIVTLSACQSRDADIAGETVDVDGGSYTNINSSQLNEILKKKDFVFVNVHIPFAGDIPRTDLSIPFDQIGEPEYLSQLPVDKDEKIVLYCRSGRMSQIASEQLVALGYTNVWNFKNGMVEWEQAGHLLENK